jgi:hypothetical protein
MRTGAGVQCGSAHNGGAHNGGAHNGGAHNGGAKSIRPTDAGCAGWCSLFVSNGIEPLSGP